MPIVRAQAFAIVRVPYVHEVVLGDREEKISLTVKLDLVQRSSMTRKNNGPLLGQ